MKVRRKNTVKVTSTHAQGEGAFIYDPEAGRKALLSIQDELAGIGDEMGAPRLDVARAAYAALGVARFVASSDVRPRFAELPRRAFEMANADELGTVAMATLFAAEQAQDEGALDRVPRLPAALAAEAAELETRMQTVCEYHLSDDPEIAPLLDELRPGTGYWDLLNDLKGYARIYERRAEVVQTDKKNYRAGDVKRAREICGHMAAAFFEAMPARARDAYKAYVRCWVLLERRYDEVRQAGLWLFRKEPERDSRFPSLYAVTRPNVGRPRKGSAEAPTPGTAPAVVPLAASLPTATAAPVAVAPPAPAPVADVR